MRRLLVVLVVVVAACGGTSSVANDLPVDEVASSTAATSGGVGQEPATEAPAPVAATSSTAATSDTTREKPDGPPAPEFVLALGDGGEFSPSSESRPIYMVFWAEW